MQAVQQQAELIPQLREQFAAQLEQTRADAEANANAHAEEQLRCALEVNTADDR